MKKSINPPTPTTFDYDSIFRELGEFGRFQALVYVFICLAIFVYGPLTLMYIFTAGDIEYRCHIPACDGPAKTTADDFYRPGWLSNAIPVNDDGVPAKCSRYFQVEADVFLNNCSNPANFNRSHVIDGCTNYVYLNNETTIVNEFDLHCAENEWRRTLVGSIKNIGLVVGLPIMGMLSDRYGRKTILIAGLFGCAIGGILKSFSTSYMMFVSIEFLDAAVGAGTFVSGFVLGMEVVGPGKRAFGGMLIMCCYATGVVLLGFVASVVPDFRMQLRIMYAPALLVVGYIWLVPESSRWLLIRNRKAEAMAIIKRAAKVNRVTLSEDTLVGLHDGISRLDGGDGRAELNNADSFLSLFRSKSLCWRTMNCVLCWLVNTFVTYSLVVDSVRLGGNKYANFMLMNGTEIVAYVMTFFLMSRVGRRYSLCGLMLLSGCACLGTLFVTDKSSMGVRLALFLVGKFAITSSFNVLYVFTTEIFPTSYRNGMISTCSMVGRISAIFAPQTPLLANYMPELPAIIYTSSAIISGLLVLCFPETYNSKLPDTVDDAITIGQPSPKRTTIKSSNSM